jgi:hypothetical protein
MRHVARIYGLDRRVDNLPHGEHLIAGSEGGESATWRASKVVSEVGESATWRASMDRRVDNSPPGKHLKDGLEGR